MTDTRFSEHFEPEGPPVSPSVSSELDAGHLSDDHRADEPGDGSFYGAWLASLCARLDGVQSATVLVLQDGESLRRVASWPTAAVNVEALRPVLERATRSKRTEAQVAAGPASDPAVLTAYPITILDRVYALVGLCIARKGGTTGIGARLQAVPAHAVTLREFLQRKVLEDLHGDVERIALVNDLVACLVETVRFQEGAMRLTVEVAQRFGCERASVGVCAEDGVTVRALSTTANPDLKGTIVRQIGDAMSEVVRAGKAISVPAGGEDGMRSGDHAALAEAAKDVAVCSVPLMSGATIFGVMSCERTRGAPFSDREVEVLATLGKLLGPILEQNLVAERGILRHCADEVRFWSRALVGPRHPGLKLLVALTVVVALSLTFIHADYRVAARTVVEGAVQRAVVAPFDGYVAESMVRAGDTVAKGQVIVRLDDRDLLVERAKWTAEREQHLRKYRQAQAAYDRAAMSVIGAQVNQTEAQLNLVEEKLARARMIAPFDGVVISGDLSQLLGTPVEQGKLLFEVAPLDAYRVILKVDERDITYVALGQRGELRLSGLPSSGLPFTVKQITSVSTAEQGHNYFRVEAQMESPSARLRPGMEGVGKIVTPRQSLIWIWTHQLTDWLRLTLWSWLP